MDDIERMRHEFVSGAAGLQYFRGFRVGRSEPRVEHVPHTALSGAPNESRTLLWGVAAGICGYSSVAPPSGTAGFIGPITTRHRGSTASTLPDWRWRRRTQVAETHEENWDEVIPLFIYGTEDQADFLYPLMERAIEKCSRVVDRHAMTPPRSQQKDFKRPQLNRWIDDNYTLDRQGPLL